MKGTQMLLVVMKMIKGRTDMKLFCVSSIAANVQFPYQISVSIQCITFPQATTRSKLRSDVTAVRSFVSPAWGRASKM